MLKKALAGILTALLCAVCFFGTAAVAAETDFSENEFTKCAENSLYELYVIGDGERSGEFYIKNKESGEVFYSNPQDRDFSSEGLSEAGKESSQLLVQLYSEESGALRTLNSFNGTNSGEALTVTAKDGGFDSAYKINGAVKLTLKIRLTDNGFTAETDVSKINNIKNNVVTNIQLLPYFFSSSYGKEGWTLVPDGSGALIYNNTENANAAAYEKAIYGADAAFAETVKATETEQVYMPVFGAKTADGAYLAVIDTGAENAYINATSASFNSDYNRVYASFKTVGSDKISIGEGVGEISANTETYNTKAPLTKKIKVSYLLADGNTDYSFLATLYREHLGLKSGNVSSEPSVFLELYGGLKRKESVLGIPLTVFKKLTTVEQAKEIAEYFKTETDSQPIISYRNVDSAIITGKIQNKYRFKSSLGSKKELEELKELCGGKLYLENNIFSAQKGGNGFSTFRDAAVRINRNNALVYSFNQATTLKDKNKPASYAISSAKLKSIYTKYFNSLKKSGFETAFINLGNTAYSDFNTDGYISRADTVKAFAGLIEKYGKNGAVYAPNAYAFSYGKYAVDTPIYSSNYDIIDEDIPFYQLVLSGVKEYSTESLNLEANTEITFLKALESGASLKFTFVYDNIISIKNTQYDYLFGADFNNRKAETAEYQKKLCAAYKELGSRVMKRHTVLSSGVRLTEFENGSKVLINFSEKDIQTEYGTVAAKGYITVKEGIMLNEKTKGSNQKTSSFLHRQKSALWLLLYCNLDFGLHKLFRSPAYRYGGLFLQ